MPDIPKIYTAIAEWLAILALLLSFHEKVSGSNPFRTAFIVLADIGVLIYIQDICGKVTGIFWLLGMAAAVGVIVVSLFLCLETDLRTALYLSAMAFMKAEFLAALDWQVFTYYVTPMEETRSAVIGMLVLFAVCIAGLALLMLLEYRLLPDRDGWKEFSATGKQTVMIWIAAGMMFTFSNLSYTSAGGPFVGTETMEIFNIRTLFDLAGVVITESMFMQKMEADLAREATEMNAVLRSQYDQYRMSQENIDIINRKYHDLKHQLQVLRMESDDERRNACISEIEEGLQRYEMENKTGNSVLDTILTGKAETCLQQGITMTVIADGTLLNHLHVMDICTIFGNALDNALEYEVQVEDRKKRNIHVSVERRYDFVCIVVENYYEGGNDTNGSLPKTTKKDSNYHGFGLKSIEQTARKYGGHMKISTRDSWFRMEMLLPCAEEKTG